MKKIFFYIIILIIFISGMYLVISRKVPDNKDFNLSSYENIKVGYQIKYPSSWYIVVKNDAFFYIENKTNIKRGVPMAIDESDIGISTWKVSYSTIDEYMTDPTFSGLLKTTDAGRRLSDTNNVSLMNIGGRKIRVLKLHNLTGSYQEIYKFIYNNVLYDISFGSGSQIQYYKDYKILTDMISSITFSDISK